ncbi:hypothetical protein [Motilimonas cestriensis]|uniref:hypothetical protein n=1 Tax=Motilimonas cestriensis TaxID=2742685 RepID=UPI003DA24076
MKLSALLFLICILCHSNIATAVNSKPARLVVGEKAIEWSSCLNYHGLSGWLHLGFIPTEMECAQAYWDAYLNNQYHGGRKKYVVQSVIPIDYDALIAAKRVGEGLIENVYYAYKDMDTGATHDVRYRHIGLSGRVVTKDYYACPPLEHPSYTVRVDDGDGTFCQQPCHYPFNEEKGECVAYCSEGKLDLSLGHCVISDNQQAPLQCTAGNPVSISDGTKVQLEPPVYQGAGAFPLSFQYQYNGLRSPEAKALQQQSISAAADKTGWVKYVQPAGYTGLVNPPALTQLAEDKVNGVRLGGFKSWSHNYQAQLTVLLDDAESRVSLQSAAFDSRQFIKQADGSYRSRNLTSDTLSRVVDEQGSLVHWIYRSVDNQFEYYNAKGQLTRRVNKTGLSHYLEYDNHDQLALVKDDAGNQLQFSFDDKGKLLTVITPTQETISYGYDQYANLETVTKVLGTKTTERRYHYEDTRHPYALTGITDENGVRYAAWEYDEQGRAITSKHAGEVDKTTFAFEPLQTTVTNPLGKQTVYHYQNTAGAKRLSKVEGVASTNCLAANQHYTYYPNGQIETKTDWKGVVTRFEYNDRHLESKRIEAAGTPEQRVITTTWHPELNLPATVAVGNQVTTYEYHTNGLLKSQHVSKVLK